MCYRGVDWEDKKEGGGKRGRAAEEQRGLAKRYGHTIIGGVLIENPGQRRGGTGESAGPERELKGNWAQGKKRRFGIFSSKKFALRTLRPNNRSPLRPLRNDPLEPAGGPDSGEKKHQTRTKTLNYTRTQGWRLRVTDTLSEESRERDREESRRRTDRLFCFVLEGRRRIKKTKKRQSPPKYPRPSSRLGGGWGGGDRFPRRGRGQTKGRVWGRDAQLIQYLPDKKFGFSPEKTFCHFQGRPFASPWPSRAGVGGGCYWLRGSVHTHKKKE